MTHQCYHLGPFKEHPSFTAPNITSIYIIIYECLQPQPITPIISALFPKGICRFPHLDNLKLELINDLPENLRFPPIITASEHSKGLRRLLTRLPKISELELSTGSSEVPAVLKLAESERGASLRPPICTLTLEKCFHVRSFVESLEDVFRSPTFKKLHVSETDLVEVEVRRMIPLGKVVEFEEQVRLITCIDMISIDVFFSSSHFHSKHSSLSWAHKCCFSSVQTHFTSYILPHCAFFFL